MISKTLDIELDLDKACPSCGTVGVTKCGLCIECAAKSMFDTIYGIGIESVKRHDTGGLTVKYTKMGPNSLRDHYGLNCEQSAESGLDNVFRRLAADLAEGVGLPEGSNVAEIISVKIDRLKDTVQITGRVNTDGIGTVKIATGKIMIKAWKGEGAIIGELITEAAKYIVNRSSQGELFSNKNEPEIS